MLLWLGNVDDDLTDDAALNIIRWSASSPLVRNVKPRNDAAVLELDGDAQLLANQAC